MLTEPSRSRMTTPRSVEEALNDLAAAGHDGIPVAGATCVMRSPLRHEPIAPLYVVLSGIEGFDRIDVTEETIAIGPLATHDALARALPSTPDLRGLGRASARSANPGVRRIATIGGNLCTAAFAASDFAPALLSLDAEIEVRDQERLETLPVAAFLERRERRKRPWLMTRIIVPRTSRLSAHERLPMRKAGDYPCAIASVSVGIDDTGRIRDARIGVGAVEPFPRRWQNLEQALEGQSLSAAIAETAARDLIADFTGRDAVDAAGWYRTSVLPVLVRRAFETMQADDTTRGS
jgi:aerobic carbon-monoxide dehydrogenase medium subunit